MLSKILQAFIGTFMVVRAIECDAEHVHVAIYDDDKCQELNAFKTQANKLSQDDKDTFNDCHEMKIGETSRFLKNICLQLSFNIQFFSEKQCKVELDEPDFRSLYTYEWDKCYKRSATEYMIIENPYPKITAAAKAAAAAKSAKE